MLDGNELLLLIVIGICSAAGAALVMHLARKRDPTAAKSLNGEKKLGEMVLILTNDLSEANQRIGKLLSEIVQLKAMVSQLQTVVEVYQGSGESQTILVGIGSDPDLQVDLIRLRGVTIDKGPVNLLRLAPVSAINLSKVLQSARERGRPIRWVHLATKATPKGIEMIDGVCSGTWLSGEMSDVKVLMISGCDTFEVGETLSGIPVVATTLEKISHEDAKVLAGVFWQAVADGLTPPDIETRCRKRLPNKIMEMIYIRY